MIELPFEVLYCTIAVNIPANSSAVQGTTEWQSVLQRALKKEASVKMNRLEFHPYSVYLPGFPGFCSDKALSVLP